MVVPLEIWNMGDSWAETAEELAAECAHVTVEDVETWLRRGGDPNDVIQLRDGHPLQPWPFLKEVAGRGRIDLMELLLSYGADINGSAHNGVTPLLSAVLMGSLREVEFLLGKGAEFMGEELHFGGTPYGSNDILLALLRAGADITDTQYGRTAEEDAAMEAGIQSDGSNKGWLDVEDWVEKHAILRGVRIAGSYKRWALQPHYSLLVLLALCHRRRAAPTASTPSYVARLFGAAPSDREDDAESSDSSDDDQDRAAKAARATGSTTIPDVAVFQVLAFWLGDAKTL